MYEREAHPIRPREARRRRASVHLLAGLFALVTGAIATALLFAGLSFWALVIAFAVLMALVTATGLRAKGAKTFAVDAASAYCPQYVTSS